MKVSVILPVYNAEKYIEYSIKSIIDQDFDGKIQLIVINDGSDDQTDDKLKSLRDRHNFKYVSRPNKGFVNTLNEALEYSEGEWIFRMDADDISHKSRISMQLNYMQKQAALLSGSYVKTFGKIISRTRTYPISDRQIKLNLLFNSPFAHPSVAFHKSLLVTNYYRVEDQPVDDYALWTRLAIQGVPMCNVPIVLLKYRLHASQMTNIRRDQFDSARLVVARNYRAAIFGNLDERVHAAFMDRSGKLNDDVIISSATQALETIGANEILATQIFLMCMRNTGLTSQAVTKILKCTPFNTTEKYLLTMYGSLSTSIRERIISYAKEIY